jgi:hypothetical protein
MRLGEAVGTRESSDEENSSKTGLIVGFPVIVSKPELLVLSALLLLSITPIKVVNAANVMAPTTMIILAAMVSLSAIDIPFFAGAGVATVPASILPRTSSSGCPFDFKVSLSLTNLVPLARPASSFH